MAKNVSLVFDRRHTATAQKPSALEFVVPMGAGRRRYLPTGLRLLPDEWDGEKIVGRPDARKLNREIEAARLRANGQIVAAITLYGELTDADVDRIFGVDRAPELRRPELFIPWAREQNALSSAGPCTKERRELVLRKLEHYRLVRTFADLTPATVKKFDDLLRREGGRTDITLRNCWHKPLQWLCGCAVTAELIDKNPYTVFRPKVGHSKPRNPLTADELMLLRRAALPAALARVRDLFIFCAYTGLAYSDAVTVTPDDIVERGGRRYIDTTRRKTGSRFITPLLAPAAEVFDRYGGSVPNISNQKANEQLHAIERRLGLTKPLTTHVARHTFATTVALANGVPIESLSRMLGHRDIHTTQIYAKVLAQTVVDDGAELAGKIR